MGGFKVLGVGYPPKNVFCSVIVYSSETKAYDGSMICQVTPMRPGSTAQVAQIGRAKSLDFGAGVMFHGHRQPGAIRARTPRDADDILFFPIVCK